MHAALYVDVLDVGLQRAGGDEQLPLDLLVGLAARDEAAYLVLAGGSNDRRPTPRRSARR